MDRNLLTLAETCLGSFVKQLKINNSCTQKMLQSSEFWMAQSNEWHGDRLLIPKDLRVHGPQTGQ